MASPLLPTFVRSSASVADPPRRSSAMLNLDIINSILDVLEEDKTTILTLSLVSKSCAHLGLARIWKDIPDFRMLDKHGAAWLEELIVKRKEGSDDLVSHASRDGIFGDVHARIQSYFSMIRSLQWTSYSGPLLPVIDHLLSHFRGDALAADIFPNLNYLTWLDDQAACHRFLPILMKPHRQSFLSVSYTGSTADSIGAAADHTLQFMQLLRSHKILPNAITLSFSGLMEQADPGWNQASASFIDRLRGYILQIPGLTELSLYTSVPHSPGLSVLPEVSVLRNLTHLGFEMRDASGTNAFHFPNLQQLDISFVTPHLSCIDFMRRLDCPKLAYLGIGFGGSTTPDEEMSYRLDMDRQSLDIPAGIFDIGILGSDYFKRLSSFAVCYISPAPPPNFAGGVFQWRQWMRSMEDAVVGRVLRIGFRHTQLIHLAIETSAWTTGGGMAFRGAMRRAYPYLRELAITRPRQGYTYDGPPMNADLPSVQLLVAALPRLEALHLAFKTDSKDLMRADTPSFNIEGASPCPTLKYWNVLDSDLCGCYTGTLSELPELQELLRDNAIRLWEEDTDYKLKWVARHIQTAFPMLEHLDWHQDRCHRERWEVVRSRVLRERGLLDYADEYMERSRRLLRNIVLS